MREMMKGKMETKETFPIRKRFEICCVYNEESENSKFNTRRTY